MKLWVALMPLVLCSCALSTERAIVDGLFADYSGPTTPGAAVRVIRDGEVLLSRGYGMANISAGEQVGDSSNFRLASITKQFTAMSILMLVDGGQLTLATTLPQIFPDFPPYGRAITVEHLLRHQSGLRDYEPLVAEDAEPRPLDAEVLALMMQQDAGDFPPGTDYSYSNSGYAVLAMIVEQLSGRSFAEFLDERIFTPVGMQNTVAFVESVSSVPNRAMGYRVTEGSVEFSDQSLYSAVLGDGGIYSSLVDLTLWDASLYLDDLISPALKERMLTPALENYGYGWRIDRYRGHRRYHHSGSTSGFRNYLQRFPDEKLTVIVLTNRAEPDVDRLGEQVADLFLP